MNPNKYLIICSSLLLLAAGTAACSSSPVNLGAGRDGVEILDTAPDDEDGDESACVYEDVDYASGETFPSSDGCNTCSCSDGNVGCTKKACLTPEPGQCLYAGALYDDGAVIPMTDGCNTCSCKDGDIGGCTQGMCEPDATGCDVDGKHYKDGEKLPSSDCNTVWCENGMIATTAVACPPPGDCTYDGNTIAAGETFVSDDDLTICSCSAMGLSCETQDMCTASVRLCIADGGDPKACEAMFAGCMPGAPTLGECKDKLTTCESTPLPMGGGMPLNCAALYASCVGQVQPVESMCDAGYDACLAASPEDKLKCNESYVACSGAASQTDLDDCNAKLASCETDDSGTDCKDIYGQCVGDVTPNMCANQLLGCVAKLPEDSDATTCKDQYTMCESAGNTGMQAPTVGDCKDRMTACYSSGGMNCEVEYTLCTSVAVPDGSCEVNGVVYGNGESLPDVDCNTQTCLNGMVVSTMMACGDTRGSLDWTCDDAYQQCLSQNEETPEACSTALTECLQTPN